MGALVRISTRQAMSVKRSGPFSEPPDSENQRLLSSSASQKSALKRVYVCLAPQSTVSV